LDRNAFSEVFMIRLTTAVSSGFTWSTLPHNQGYELRLNGELAGTLRRRSARSADFEAETSAGSWIFRRSGFWGSRAEIFDSTSQQLIASFSAEWASQGRVTFSDGQEFGLHCKGLWHPTWTVTSRDGKVAFSLHTREKTVEVAARRLAPEGRLNLLIMFMLYRVLQADEDVASAAMVA
jgi:hypothetical protein